MIRPATWLPLAALSLLVALTLWLNQLVQAPASRADGSKRHDPDLIVESFNARTLGEDGRVLYTLAARKMVHYPDDDSALLETVKVEAYEPRQPRMMITADHGRLEQGGERILIEGNVVIVRDADAKYDPARVTTDKLLVLPDAGIARTQSEVIMESPSGRVVAQGLELDNRARVIQTGRVRAVYKGTR